MAEGIQNLPCGCGGCAQAQALALLHGLRAHPATQAPQLTSTWAVKAGNSQKLAFEGRLLIPA